MRQIERRVFQAAVGLVVVVGMLAVAETVSAQVPTAATGEAGKPRASTSNFAVRSMVGWRS